MRLIFITVLTIILLGPRVADSSPPAVAKQARHKLIVLLDASASMQTLDADSPGHAPNRSRFDAARQWLTPDRLDAWRRSFDMDTFAFDTDIRPLSATLLQQPAAQSAAGRGSRIAASIRQALEQANPGSQRTDLLLLSDGRDTEPQDPEAVAALARSHGVRIDAVCFGAAVARRDLALAAAPGRDHYLSGEPASILARVYQSGFANAPVALHVRSPDGDTTLHIQLTDAASTVVMIPIKTSRLGVSEYKLSVDPLAGEDRTDNNAQSVLVNVTGKRIKALLVEGQPHWDTRFLAMALRQDERIELTAVTELAAGRREAVATHAEDAVATLPGDAEELSRYDVVILGRGVGSVLSPRVLAAAPEYVASGGHVIFARGRADESGALAAIEPVVWGERAAPGSAPGPLALTRAGRGVPLFASAGRAIDADRALASLPPAPLLWRGAQLKPAAQVLIQTAAPDGERPALVAMEYGRGRVVTVLAEGLWRWKMRPSPHDEFAGVYDLLWCNTVRWLALGGDFQPGEQVSLSLSPVNVGLGEAVAIEAVARRAAPGFTPTLRVWDAAGWARGVAMAASGERSWRAAFTAPAAGRYRAVLDAEPLDMTPREQPFNVYDSDTERVELSADPQAMRRLAELTGGAFLRPDRPDSLPAALDDAAGATQLNDARPTRWAWDRPALMAALVMWLGLEWLIRRRAGWL